MRLEQSLVELFRIYEESNGAGEEVLARLDGRMERCLGAAGVAKERLQQHLYVLSRAKEMHLFVMADPELRPLKLQLLEHVLFFRTPAERWAAIRDLLLAHLDLICRSPLPGAPGNEELYKQEQSHGGSRLGRMLVATALFNFDLDEEQPPECLRLRFKPGRFPDHVWEVTDAGGGAALRADALGWSPRSPLCRWEYLSADLAHAICRVRGERGGRFGRGLPALPAGHLPHTAADAAPGDESAAEATDCRLYCRIPERRGGPGPEQVELLTLDPATFLAEVQRRVHQRLGAEGVRLFALLMARLHASRPAEVVDLDPGVLLCQAAEPGEPARAARVRLRKLSRLLELLAEIELRRVLTQGGRSRLEESRFLTVLSRAGELAPAESPQAAAGRAPGEVSRVRLMVDPCFHDAGGASLGQPYVGLPERLLRLPSGEHPLAVGLYVYLRAAWARVAAGEPATVACRAGQLLHDAGFRLGETTRYRLVEALKRELVTLRELGFLSRWRIERSPARDVLDDTYRLDAPVAGVPAAGAPWPAAPVPHPSAPPAAPPAQWGVG